MSFLPTSNGTSNTPDKNWGDKRPGIKRRNEECQSHASNSKSLSEESQGLFPAAKQRRIDASKQFLQPPPPDFATVDHMPLFNGMNSPASSSNDQSHAAGSAQQIQEQQQVSGGTLSMQETDFRPNRVGYISEQHMNQQQNNAMQIVLYNPR